jgi:NAD(P)-dependent dehydrogenase (short-subunit alcohol dehydrogenase family)
MIIITGASRGIGQYLREEFKLAGEKVFGTYHKTTLLNDGMEGMERVDISDYSDVQRWVSSIEENLTHITLINCAGINHTALAHKVDIVDWAKVINTNLIGTFNVIRQILPIMKEQNFGRIINLSSVVAQTFVPGTSAYSASKAGLWGLSRSVAIENASNGITINNLNLGYYNIGMIKQVPEQFQSKIKRKIPIGKFGNPKEIFNAINLLIESEYINGTSIDMNGGIF